MHRPALLFLGAALLAAATIIAYAPALHGTWLWDDPTEIVHQAWLRLPAGEALPHIWRGEGQQDYFPLKTSVQWAQWQLWRENVLGYHLTNVVLQIASALLFWRVLRRLGASLLAAYLAALLFALHPAAVLSVAWISELKNTLSLTLLLASFLAWLRPGRSHRILSLSLFAAAALAKSSVVPFPAVLLLHAWWRDGRISRQTLFSTLPFFAVGSGLGLLTVHFQSARVIAPLAMHPDPLALRAAIAGRAAWTYLVRVFCPSPLLPILPGWHFVHPLAAAALLWLPLLALLTATARHRTLAFGLGTWFLFLLPILGLIPLAFARIAPVSDHLAYLSLLGPLGLLAAALTHWENRPPLQNNLSPSGSSGPSKNSLSLFLLPGKNSLSLFFLLSVVPFFCVTRTYAARFTSEEVLWRYELAHDPEAWLAQNNLGIVLAESGRLEEAVPLLEAAVRLQPTLVGARLNLARARETLRVMHNNRGTALARAGRLSEAIAEFRQAIAADPGNPGVHRNLSFALHSLGQDQAALAEWDLASRLEASNRR